MRFKSDLLIPMKEIEVKEFRLKESKANLFRNKTTQSTFNFAPKDSRTIKTIALDHQAIDFTLQEFLQFFTIPGCSLSNIQSSKLSMK